MIFHCSLSALSGRAASSPVFRVVQWSFFHLAFCHVMGSK